VPRSLSPVFACALMLGVLMVGGVATGQSAPELGESPDSTIVGEVLAVGLGLSLSVMCVLMHYEGLRILSRWLIRLDTRPRPRILALILSLLVLHQAEAWMFAWGYFGAVLQGQMGHLEHAVPSGLFTYAYFSITTYTTLGFGDIVPVGPIRFLTSVEALTGFVLITWSASFTFLEMQRFWKDR